MDLRHRGGRMIGWRYHLISIVAVFLALGLGLLMGTALLNDRLVQNLRDRTEIAQDRLDEQEGRLATLASFAAQVLPFAAEDRLFGQTVVVITHEGVDEGAVSDVRRALDLAGARVLATLSLQPSIAAASPPEQRALSDLLQIPEGAAPEAISAAVADALADRLTTGALPGAPEEDLLARLLSEGFLVAVDPALDSTVALGGPDQVLVFVGGSDVPREADPTGALRSLVRLVAQRGAVLAVGERTTSTAGVVRSIREEVQTDGPVVTVDDLDMPAGVAALILGLERAIETGEGGHFGVGEGAQQLMPPAA